jgi:hypothetical protein
MSLTPQHKKLKKDMTMSPNNFATTDAQEAEFRRVIQPMIRPLIVIIGSAVQASEALMRDQPIGHHEQNIEDSLLQIIKHCAESDVI